METESWFKLGEEVGLELVDDEGDEEGKEVLWGVTCKTGLFNYHLNILWEYLTSVRRTVSFQISSSSLGAIDSLLL